MKRIIFLIALITPFIFLKFTNLGIRLSDTNVYFNVAFRIMHGQVPYRDFFFANFPIFAYISAFYYFLTRGNINLFYLTSIIETIIVTLLIYKISYEKTKNYLISITSSSLYIYSFIVLSTSDHQTGVSTASLFAVLGFYFLKRERGFISGLLISLSILTKAYFLPITLSFLLYLLIIKQWKRFATFSLGLITASLVILLPFLTISPKQFIYDIFGFSLTRPSGLVKIDIFWFFVTKDFLFLIIFLFNLFNFKKNIFFALTSLFAILFFIGYQDIYYLYLNFITPFLCLSFYEIYNFLKNTFNLQRLIIPTIVCIFLMLNFFTYLSSYRNLQKVNDVDKIVYAIKNNKPDFLYGYNGLTPALSAMLNIPSLSNVNDAYVYFFRRGIYNKEILTNQAISTKTIVITQGADYPQFNLKQDILDNEIINKETIYKYCENILSVPIKAEGDTNKINLFKCY